MPVCHLGFQNKRDAPPDFRSGHPAFFVHLGVDRGRAVYGEVALYKCSAPIPVVE